MIKGTKSGTTLRSILSRMINPTERAAEVMEELGIQFYNTDGTMKSLSEIITTVNEKTSGLTEQQRNQALSTIYGQQALTGLLALMEAGPGKIDELTNSYLNCDGAAADMAATINNNTKGAWIEFKSALEGAAIAIGEVLLPHLRKGIEWLTNMVTAFGNLDPAIQENIVKWGAIAAAIGPVLIVGGKFVGLVGTIVSAVSSLGGAFATLAGPVGWIALAGTAVAGLIVSWNAMQDSLDRSTKSFENASNNLESFEGKVRSTDYLMAEVFGKEIEIKFSAEWEGVKEQAQTFYTDLNNDLKSYYEEKSKIDHDGCTDLELHEKHKMDIKEKYAKLQAQQMAQNTQLEGRHDEIMNQLTPFLMEEGLSSLTAGDLQGQMSPWIKEKIRLVQEGEQEIYDIYENAYIMQRELTSVEQARILELEEQLGKDRAILTTNNMNDLMEVWELEHEAEKAMINDRAKTYRKYSESVEDAVWDASQAVSKSIDKEIEELKRRETQWGVSCQEEIEALKGKQFAVADFSEDYGRRTQANIDKGQEFTTASKNAFESIVRDLETGKIHVKDFGLTQEEYLSLAIQTMIEAGASADELADAINLIPEDKRPKVLADVQGKTQAEQLKAAIDRLNNKTVKVITQYENWYTDKNTGKKYGYQDGVAGYYATGTEHALSGVATVAEYGPEIIANNNTAMLATGRQMVNLSGGEKIYNARQTKDILDNMGKSSQIDYSDSLRIINSNIILLKEAIERKNFNNVVNNNIEKIDINEVANIEEIEYQLTEMMERRTYGGV